MLVLLNLLSNVVLPPQGTGHIRTASLRCALACAWSNHWENKISVNKLNFFIFIHSLNDINKQYLAAQLALVWQFFFIVHYLNVLCKTLDHLLMIIKDERWLMFYAISLCFYCTFPHWGHSDLGDSFECSILTCLVKFPFRLKDWKKWKWKML